MKEIIILAIMRKLNVERENAEFMYELFKNEGNLERLYRNFVLNEKYEEDCDENDFLHSYYSY